jgi:alcohol dehydrogenase class IV
MLHAPHGAICARLLPLVMEANLRALQARQPDHPARARYEEVARLLTGKADASAADGVTWVSTLVRDLNIPALSAHGLTSARFAEVVTKTLNASSFKGNPIPLTGPELLGILERAL